MVSGDYLSQSIVYPRAENTLALLKNRDKGV
jgi:hypothetical protein